MLSYVLEKQNSVISLSFFGTAIAIYVGYINPAEKWQQLRMAECSIRSEVSVQYDFED